MQNRNTIQRIVVCGLIAALYTALGIAFAPISFGAVQVRVAEAMTLLPLFTPFAALGLTVGCVLTNLYGLAMGANILGVADIFLGSAATLVAALLTRALRGHTYKGIPLLSVLPPILLNALVVGGELTLVMAGGWSLPIFLLNFAQVGLGQLLACGGIGLPIAIYLSRPGLADRIFPANR